MANKETLDIVRHQLDAIRKNGVLDGENADRSENLHRLFAYPAMMVPMAQYAIIKAISTCLPPKAMAIDPFMGSGTSLMSCMEFGFRVFGQDINPLAVLLTKAKVYKYDMKSLRSKCQIVLDSIRDDKSVHIDVGFHNIDKWFNHNTQVDLSKIRRAINNINDSAIRCFLWIIMAEVIRTGSNDRTSTFKLHCREKSDIEHRKDIINILKNFSTLLQRSIDDIETYWSKIQVVKESMGGCYMPNAEIVWGDTKNNINTTKKFDLLVSSPPYGDNHTTVTYGQTSFLPLQWIDSSDINCPFDYLKTTQEIDRQSLGGTLNRKEVLRDSDCVLKKSQSLRVFYESIPDEEKNKYLKTLSFITDFDKSLDKIVAVMKDDAFYIWTIGNRFVGNREIPNDQILIDLMAVRDIPLFERAERQILNKKQAPKNNFSNTMEKEHILIFHKAAVL